MLRQHLVRRMRATCKYRELPCSCRQYPFVTITEQNTLTGCRFSRTWLIKRAQNSLRRIPRKKMKNGFNFGTNCPIPRIMDVHRGQSLRTLSFLEIFERIIHLPFCFRWIGGYLSYGDFPRIFFDYIQILTAENGY